MGCNTSVAAGKRGKDKSRYAGGHASCGISVHRGVVVSMGYGNYTAIITAVGAWRSVRTLSTLRIHLHACHFEDLHFYDLRETVMASARECEADDDGNSLPSNRIKAFTEECTGRTLRRPGKVGTIIMTTTPMSAVWQSIPLEITTMILVETALLPLKVHAHSYLHHRYISALETTNPPSTNAWQVVLSALAINHSTRRAVIHALNTNGAIEHKTDPGVAYTAHFGPQPSWALLAHFRWVFVSVEDRMDRDDVRCLCGCRCPGRAGDRTKEQRGQSMGSVAGGESEAQRDELQVLELKRITKVKGTIATLQRICFEFEYANTTPLITGPKSTAQTPSEDGNASPSHSTKSRPEAAPFVHAIPRNPPTCDFYDWRNLIPSGDKVSDGEEDDSEEDDSEKDDSEEDDLEESEFWEMS
ncbi:uncharacterized protein MYCGRDRAFT_94762 [Zymoseptoria tritici IPO323]|uniref:Uncharacterized protein n=1 Tax=Zymoseptoria tritici (strain CBS 115943 / IPO323) TaxID=336722 RepID=F9XEY0_ZYMTI|nr:uncharacterized protein MYCGRDRAFT_94762 [Zymoseptoria tritici IPO323]EGP85960.1 hypothetical protein MYCGRDRAFT_94762 [Zymoseptoria tritici IPO323]